jgi:PelA/Pel-15E family pectate lyase
MMLKSIALSLLSLCATAQAAELTREEAATALRKGVDYFRTQVSEEGGYLWCYAADLSEQEGETPASATTVWVQPPGTPAVGLAYLAIHEMTGDAYYLEAAREVALCLVRGQLDSGGWDYRIEFDPAERAKYAYRVDSAARAPDAKLRNTTTLDDNVTQEALRCLMLVDRALDFKDETIHEAARYALRKLAEAQYPNGAWPQRFAGPPDPAKFPVKPASYPESWSRTFPNVPYSDFYTFNDNTLADVIEVMFLGAEVYRDEAAAASAQRGGDFMILAQMPDPQPGWAQQYDAEMHPAWARKFEPPAITGSESQGVMRSLLRVFELTGDKKYLDPIPRALAYYRASVLPDGQLARFYELQTNTPLYFTKDYQMTYSDADMPTHYGFKTSNGLDAIDAEYQRLAAMPADAWTPVRLVQPAVAPPASDKLADTAAAIVNAQNEVGAWVEPAKANIQGKMEEGIPALYSDTFTRNILTLARFIAAK